MFNESKNSCFHLFKKNSVILHITGSAWSNLFSQEASWIIHWFAF